jgi:hypothetical protein
MIPAKAGSCAPSPGLRTIAVLRPDRPLAGQSLEVDVWWDPVEASEAFALFDRFDPRENYKIPPLGS